MTWSTFMDVDNFPETVDYNGPIGNTFIRQPFCAHLHHHGTRAASRWPWRTPRPTCWTGGPRWAARKNAEYGVAASTSLSRLPDLVLRSDRSLDWGSMSVRGMTQELRFDDGAGLHPSARGWGAGTSVLVKSVGSDWGVVALTYGDGIGRYMNYLEGAVYDPASGEIRMERAIGLVAGYQWKPRADLRFNFVYGMTRELDNDYTDAIRALGLDGGRFGVNRTVQSGHLGAIFTPVKSVDLGLEGVWGYRKTLAGEKGEDFRVNFSAKYYIN